MTENPTSIDNQRIDDLANRLFFRLYQSANLLHKTGTKALEGTSANTTTQQWAIIGALVRPGSSEGIAVGELTRFLLVSRQNLTGMLSRMERDGIVERIVSPSDSRSRLIRLTEKGEKLWRDEMQGPIGEFYRTALAGFSNTDKIHAIHYLDKLLDNMMHLSERQEDL